MFVCGLITLRTLHLLLLKHLLILKSKQNSPCDMAIFCFSSCKEGWLLLEKVEKLSQAEKTHIFKQNTSCIFLKEPGNKGKGPYTQRMGWGHPLERNLGSSCFTRIQNTCYGEQWEHVPFPSQRGDKSDTMGQSLWMVTKYNTAGAWRCLHWLWIHLGCEMARHWVCHLRTTPLTDNANY